MPDLFRSTVPDWANGIWPGTPAYPLPSGIAPRAPHGAQLWRHEAGNAPGSYTVNDYALEPRVGSQALRLTQRLAELFGLPYYPPGSELWPRMMGQIAEELTERCGLTQPQMDQIFAQNFRAGADAIIDATLVQMEITCPERVPRRPTTVIETEGEGYPWGWILGGAGVALAVGVGIYATTRKRRRNPPRRRNPAPAKRRRKPAKRRRNPETVIVVASGAPKKRRKPAKRRAAPKRRAKPAKRRAAPKRRAKPAKRRAAPKRRAKPAKRKASKRSKRR